MGIANIISAVEMLMSLVQQGSAIAAEMKAVSDLIAKARAENRDITDAELDTLAAATDKALADAKAAGQAAKAAGR